MPLTASGRDHITSGITGVVVVPFDHANAHIGVGDDTTGFLASQLNLVAPINKIRKPMDATFPLTGANTITLQSTFTGAEANFTWNEWGVFNAATAGTMLSRKVEHNGTKLAGQTWILQVQLTVTIGA